MVLEAWVNSIFFIPSVVFLSAVLGFILLSKLYDKRADDDEMEREGLEAVVKDEVAELVKIFGGGVHKQITFGMKSMGKVNKAYQDTEKVKLEVEYETEDGETKTKETVETQHFHFFKMYPASSFKRFMAVLFDEAGGSERYTTYIRIHDDYVSEGEVISIDPTWNPTKMGGIWLYEGEEGADFVQEKTYKAMFEETLETAKESIRAVNNMNLQFVQSQMEMEKLKEMKGGNLQQQLEEFMEGN